MKRNPRTQIIITAPRKMEVTDEVRTQIIAALTFLPENSEIRVRADMRGRFASPIEEWVSEICRVSGTDLHSFGTGTNCKAFERDRQMVQGVQQVIAFFPEATFMEGGTGHVVQCALEADVTTEAWVETLTGLELVAESDTGIDHMETWLKSRVAAHMVLKNMMLAESVPLSVGSWRPSPPTRSSSTTTGSTSTELTGGVRFLHGSTSTPQQAD